MAANDCPTQGMPEPRDAPVRSSNITCREKCPRKFLFRVRYGLMPHGRRAALDIGSTFHRTLQLLYEGNSWEQAEHTLNTEHTNRRDFLAGLADEAGLLPSGEDLEGAQKSLDMTHYKGIAMGRIFWRHHPLDHERYPTLKDPHGHPFIEKTVEMEARLQDAGLHTCRIQLDRVVMDPDEPAVWIIDHKTTSANPLLRAQALALSVQAQLYHFVLDRWLSEVPSLYPEYPRLKVKGIIHNIVRTPTIRYCSKDANFAAYIERVAKWYEDQNDEAVLAAGDAYSSGPPMIQAFTRLPKSPYQPDFLNRLVPYTEASTHDPTDLAYFWQAGDYVCHDFNSPCPYLRLCCTTSARWPQIIRDHFKQAFREDEED